MFTELTLPDCVQKVAILTDMVHNTVSPAA